jgi:uncharacterized protein (DUF433 family)
MTAALETPTDEWPIVRNPRVMGGPPCFRGTRTPVTVLFDDLTAGVPLEEILLNYPTLARQDALAVLRAAGRIGRHETARPAGRAAPDRPATLAARAGRVHRRVSRLEGLAGRGTARQATMPKSTMLMTTWSAWNPVIR